MTFEFCHRKLRTFHEELKVFDEQLKEIHPDADLCYHSGYGKFTMSLFSSDSRESPTRATLERSHLNIHCSFIITLDNEQQINKLADDLNRFIQRK